MTKIRRKPHRIRKKKSILRSRFFWLTLLFLILAGSVFYLIVFSSFFQIQEIKCTDEGVRKIIIEEIGKRLLFLPTNSIFLANLSKIHKKVLKEFPQIEKAYLKRDFPDSLVVIIKERIPIGLWCPDKQECYLIDRKAVKFGQISLASTTPARNATPARHADASHAGWHNVAGGLDLIISSQECPEKEDVTAILQINKKLKEELEIEIKEFIISFDHLTAKTIEGWEIYFNLKENILQQLFNLEALLEEQLPFEEYIDLRFGNRINYK